MRLIDKDDNKIIQFDPRDQLSEDSNRAYIQGLQDTLNVLINHKYINQETAIEILKEVIGLKD